MSISSLFAPNTYDLHVGSLTIGGKKIDASSVGSPQVQVVHIAEKEAEKKPKKAKAGTFSPSWAWVTGTDTSDPVVEGAWVLRHGIATCDVNIKGLSAKAGKPNEVTARVGPLPYGPPTWLSGFAIVHGNHTDVHASVKANGDSVEITFDGTICCGDATMHIVYEVRPIE